MITDTLLRISTVLNDFCKTRLNVEETFVVINRLANIDGSAEEASQNRLVITLVQVAEDSSMRQQPMENLPLEGDTLQLRKPAYLLQVLVTANFSDYTQSLRMIDLVLEFITAHPVLNTQDESGQIRVWLSSINATEMVAVLRGQHIIGQPVLLLQVNVR